MTNSTVPTVPTIELVRVVRVLQEAGYSTARIEAEQQIVPGLLGYLDKNTRTDSVVGAGLYGKVVAFANRTIRERPGHIWAKADDMAGRIHDACRMMLASRTVTWQEIERETGLGSKTQERIRERLGLVYLTTRHPEFEDISVTRLVETRDGAFDELVDVVKKLDEVFDAEGDLVLECLHLGLLAVHSHSLFGKSSVPKIPVSHPSAAAWRAEQQRRDSQLVAA